MHTRNSVASDGFSLTHYRKWIRLLFGREFEFDEVLSMWDVIFAEDPSLEIVDLICLVMILRLHWDCKLSRH